MTPPRHMIFALSIGVALVAFGQPTMAGGLDPSNVATIEKKATLPVLVPEEARVRGDCNCVLILETAGVAGNSSGIPLSGSVVLKVGEGQKERRVELGHFFIFGSQSEAPENYAFDLMTNPEVTPSILQATKAGFAEAEVTISPPQHDRSKAMSIRLPISKSYLQASR